MFPCSLKPLEGPHYFRSIFTTVAVGMSSQKLNPPQKSSSSLPSIFGHLLSHLQLLDVSRTFFSTASSDSQDTPCFFKAVCDVRIRLFTVLYFFRKIIEIESFALRVTHFTTTQGTGARPIIPDARPLGTFENQDSRDGKTRYI